MHVRPSATTVITYCVLAMAGTVPILLPAQLVSNTAHAAGGDLVVTSARTFAILEAADPTPGNNCLDVHGNLILESGGSISRNDWGSGMFPNSSAGSICIQISGDLELQSGTGIYAENRVAGGSGGRMSISVGGRVTIRDNATISSSKTAGAGDTGVGGDITIQATGAFVAEPNSKVLSDSTGFGGDIHISAATIQIDGTISTKGSSTRGLGGQIYLIAGGDLTTGDASVIRSRGQDPGADLVHLQGCNVTVHGLVESTGPGHWSNAPNHVKPPHRAGKPINSSGGIEIWAGDSITIDSTPPHTGELNADIGMSGGANGRGWIDLFAHGNINIIGDSAGAMAVHANLILGNGRGGLVTLISSEGGVTASGLALQANDGAAGGAGGIVDVQAMLDVDFGSAIVRARGSTGGGGGQAGGRIFARSFSGQILGATGGQLDCTGGSHSASGQVNLQGCAGVTYGGTAIPAYTTLAPGCGETLTLPVGIPACGVVTVPDATIIYD